MPKWLRCQMAGWLSQPILWAVVSSSLPGFSLPSCNPAFAEPSLQEVGDVSGLESSYLRDDTMSALVWAPVSTQQQLLATGNSNGVVSVWALPSGHEVKRFRPAPVNKVTSLSFSADARYLAASYTNLERTYVWDLTNDASPLEVEGAVFSFSPKIPEKFAVVGYDNKLTYRDISAASSGSARLLSETVGSPFKLVWQTDGTSLSAISRAHIRTYEVDEPGKPSVAARCVDQHGGEGVCSDVSYVSELESFVTITSSGVVGLVSPSSPGSPSPLGRVDTCLIDSSGNAEWAEKSKLLAVSGASIELWDISSFEQAALMGRLGNDASCYSGLSVSSDGAILAALERSDATIAPPGARIALWDLSSGVRLNRLIPGPIRGLPRVSGLAASQDARNFLVSDQSSFSAHVWEYDPAKIPPFEAPRTVPFGHRLGTGTTAMAFASDGSALALAERAEVALWHRRLSGFTSGVGDRLKLSFRSPETGKIVHLKEGIEIAFGRGSRSDLVVSARTAHRETQPVDAHCACRQVRW